MFAFGVIAAMTALEKPIVISGRDVELRLEQTGGEITEAFYAKDAGGKFRLLLVSLTRPGLAIGSANAAPTAIHTANGSLYPEPPTFRFTNYKIEDVTGGKSVQLSSKTPEGDFIKTIRIPNDGNDVSINLAARLPEKHPKLISLLMSYAFLPDGKTMSHGGKPDSTFLPGLRPADDDVVGDHEFRAPVAMAQQGPLAAMIVPNVDLLFKFRAMETILDLDCKNGVVDAPLMSFGFAAHRVRGHVYFATDFANPRRVPQTLHLGMTLLLNANAIPHAAYEDANKYLWSTYGSRYFNDVLPQAMPFEDYAKFCYPAAFKETFDNIQIGWFEHEIDGHVCGGIPAGWGFARGYVSWQCWFNNLRSAYGMRSWGTRLNNPDWVQKADKMLNLALAAPLDRGACPTTYDSRKHEWIGCLLQPRIPGGEGYYDLTNMAWKGIWLLRWQTDFKDCPRKTEILDQCRAMAECMMRYQHADGSIPTCLTKDLKPVPVLDASAQTALPAWFLFKLAAIDEGAPQGLNDRLRASALRAADFLCKNVVDGHYYYDFETFFSCSPKTCLQVNGTADHEAMRDPHTLQPPQNTLSMQWTAEALREAAHTTGRDTYMTQALKALEMMNLYQVVWPIAYRKTAYTYGGFGVQNSDGEYNDARQAQFGETLCDFGAELGRQDLFERGVAAVRASLALINHPLHAEFGIYPNPNYPPGLEPENCCHGGIDEQSGRTGFDWGEGSGLASMAILLDKYGDAYVDPKRGWKVGINGLVPFKNGFARRLISDRVSNFTEGPSIEVVTAGGGRTTERADLYPSATLKSDFKDGRAEYVVSLSGGSAKDLDGFLIDANGGRIDIKGSANDREIRIPLDASNANKPWRLRGSLRGEAIYSDPLIVHIDPSFDFSPGATDDWKVEGGFAAPFVQATRVNFGIPRDEYMIGTCETGEDDFEDSYQGTITSPSFLITKPRINLLVGGGAGERVYVELIDASTGERLAIARGSNSETFNPMSWDVLQYRGRALKIRVVDHETGGWGHINVARIRCE